MVLHMLHEHDLGIYSTVDDHPHLSYVVLKPWTRETVLLCPNWAHRQNMGHTLGPNTISRYVDDLSLMFDTVRVVRDRRRLGR